MTTGARGARGARATDPVRDGLVDVSGATRLLVVGGRDRLRFLHAITTQDVQALEPGGGAYGAVTDDRGHPVGDFHLFVLPEAVLLEVSHPRAESLRAAIERWIVADDVELAWAAGVVESVETGDPEWLARAVSRPAEHLTDPVPGVSWSRDVGAEDLASIPLASGVVARRSQWGGYGACRVLAASEAESDASDSAQRPLLDVLEIESGRAGDPELTEARIWTELGIEGAVSFTKGCYPGQEILNRVRSRGGLKRRLVGLELAEQARDRLAGAALEFADGRAAGVVTRARGTHGLAFVERDAWEPGTLLVARGPEGLRLEAHVASLPFVERRTDGQTPPPFVRAELV